MFSKICKLSEGTARSQQRTEKGISSKLMLVNVPSSLSLSLSVCARMDQNLLSVLIQRTHCLILYSLDQKRTTRKGRTPTDLAFLQTNELPHSPVLPHRAAVGSGRSTSSPRCTPPRPGALYDSARRSGAAARRGATGYRLRPAFAHDGGRGGRRATLRYDGGQGRVQGGDSSPVPKRMI